MRFFIHVFNGSQIIDDPEGAEFPDLDAAVFEAAQSARDLIADQLRRGNPVPARWEARVADEDGVVLEVIPLAALVAPDDDLTMPDPNGNRETQKDACFATLFARAKASAERSRSLNIEIQATMTDIRAQLRALSASSLG